MRNYEILWILPGSASDEDVTRSLALMTESITTAGGAIHRAELWQRRTLSYPINNHMEGAYCHASFSIDPQATAALNRTLQGELSILRYLITKE